MEIYALQVNHLSNPLGYALGKGKLSFSWKVKEAKGKSQTYARVRIAADEAMQEILFDSGEDREANSLVTRSILRQSRGRATTGLLSWHLMRMK